MYRDMRTPPWRLAKGKPLATDVSDSWSSLAARAEWSSRAGTQPGSRSVANGLNQGRTNAMRRLNLLALLTLCGFACNSAKLSNLPHPRAMFSGTIPFSFSYGGRESRSLLSSWRKKEVTRVLPSGERKQLITYSDPATRLEVTSEITFFPEGDAIEWLLRFRNAGGQDTPILQDVRPMDIQVLVNASTPVTFYHVLGSAARPVLQTKKSGAVFPCPDCADAGAGEGLARDYVPLDRQLSPSDDVRLSHYVLENGKHTESYLPFFNLQLPGGGMAG